MTAAVFPLDEISKHVTDQIQRCRIADCHVDGKSHLAEFFQKLVNHGESGSISVIGPKLSCKMVIDYVLNDTEYDGIAKIYLHGMLHSDEKIVIQEIERQLKITSAINIDDENFSVADRLQNILNSISRRKSCKGISFILYEFDQFTSSTHQNFLYNILDKTQSINNTTTKKIVPMLVVCVSNRIDIVELLEKRVRSRLSQRQIHLFDDWTFDQYVEHARTVLSCNDEKFGKVPRRRWNSAVNTCLDDKNVAKILRNRFYTNKSLEYLKQTLLLVLNLAIYEQELVKAEHFTKVDQILHVDSTELFLKDLSQLDICVILAALHCRKRYPDDDYLNFEMIYSEYREFAKQSKTVFPRAIIRETLEKLEDCQIFVSKSSSDQSSNSTMTLLYDFKLLRLQMDPVRCLEFVRKSADFSVDVKNWAKAV